MELTVCYKYLGGDGMDTLDKDLQVEVYKKLYFVTEKLHSFLDMEALLSELFVFLREEFPNFSYNLFLSQVTYCHNDLPITEIDYDSENIAAVKVYGTGIMELEHLDDHTVLYVPLKGKQAVYGVLQMIAPITDNFKRYEIEYISLFAGSAGNAIENALLFRHSQQIILNLKLLNETSKMLNSNLQLAEALPYLSNQLKTAFDGQEIGFFLLPEDQRTVKILPGTTSFFFTKQAPIYIDYIKKEILRENESLFIGDLNLHTISSKSFQSIMAVPVIYRGAVRGFAVVMHQKPFFFPFDSFKLFQTLVQHSSLAIINSMLREELKRIVITDHLTKLNSRKFLDEKIEKSMMEDEQGAFIIIDIDDFKGINDKYGHQIGDEILIQVARLIKSCIRNQDVGARWGGEELAIYLPKVSLEEAVAVAQRLVEKVAQASKPHVTISCGVSHWHKDYKDSYQSLFKRADEALYLAKRSGKNKVVAQSGNIKAG